MPALYSSSTVEPPPLPEALRAKLTAQATHEPDVRARSQLASSAKRFLAPDALPIARELLYHSEDAADKQVPLLIWWALESKAVSDRAAVLALFKDSALWQTPIAAQYIVSRLGQRYTAERTPENLQTAAQLLAMAPSPQATDELIKGMELGLQGDRVATVPETLQKQVGAVWASRPHTPTLMSFALRLNYEPAAGEAVQMLGNPKTSSADRKALLTLLSERDVEAAAPVIVDLLKAETKENNRIALLQALAHFNSPEIGQTMLGLYPKASTKVRATLISSLTRRGDWARGLLEEVDRGAIKREALTPGNVFAIQNLGDAGADKLVKKLWGSVRQSSEAKEQKITNVRKLLAGAKGSPEEGKKLFTGRCAVCHTLNGEGAKIGPDLTGYERDNLDFMLPSIIDPSLAIREEYVAFNVTTKQGQSLIGFMVQNDPKVVAIKDLTGNVVKLAREDVTSLNGLTTSIMPEGLLDTMTDAEIRDLFAYLTKK
jgi:putative heme-binding domain-containing protein